jgi:hypothetical protein
MIGRMEPDLDRLVAEHSFSGGVGIERNGELATLRTVSSTVRTAPLQLEADDGVGVGVSPLRYRADRRGIYSSWVVLT